MRNNKSFIAAIRPTSHLTPSPLLGEGRGEGGAFRLGLLEFFPEAMIFFTAILLTACAHPDLTASLSCPPDTNIAPPVPSSAYQSSSIPELKAKADKGDRAAARVMAERYEHGDGIVADIGQAVEWYERAAIIPPQTHIVIVPAVGKNPSYVLPINAGPSTPGDALALSWLATLYGQGRGVPVDSLQADKLSSCAAARGGPPRNRVSDQGLNASVLEGSSTHG